MHGLKHIIGNRRLVGIILITIALFRFYSFIPIANTAIVKFAAMLMPIFMLLMSYKQFLKDKTNRFSNQVRLLIILIAISIVSAFIFWEQSFELSYRVTYVELSYIFFFYLVKCRFTIEEVESYIIIITSLYVILWVIAHIANPIPLFGGFNDEDGTGYYNTEKLSSRGFPRIQFIGLCFLPLTFFLFLVRYNRQGGKKYLLLSIGTAIVIFLHLTRGIILGTLLAYIVYMFEKRSVMRWWIVIVALVLYVSPQLLEGTIAGNLIEKTSESLDTSDGDDEDVRIREYKFYFTGYKKNVVSAFVGSGVLHMKSPLGAYEKNIAETLNYYASDVGYAQIYVYIGFIGLVIIGALWIKVLISKKVGNQYARYYLLAVMIINIFQGYFFVIDGVLSISVALYLLGIREK